MPANRAPPQKMGFPGPTNHGTNKVGFSSHGSRKILEQEKLTYHGQKNGRKIQRAPNGFQREKEKLVCHQEQKKETDCLRSLIPANLRGGEKAREKK